MEPRFAKTVVADIKAATRKDPRAAFKVDGESFPWLLSEDGPTARKIHDIYLVSVKILVVSLKDEDLPETFHHEWKNPEQNIGWGQPVIQGIVFPWTITHDGLTYRSAGCKDIPTVELEFFAEHVEGVPLEDATPPADGRFRSADGYVVRKVAA